MNRRDQELLDKQLRRVSPPQNEGLIVLTVITVFFAGMIFGSALYGRSSTRAFHVADNTTASALSRGIIMQQ